MHREPKVFKKLIKLKEKRKRKHVHENVAFRLKQILFYNSAYSPYTGHNNIYCFILKKHSALYVSCYIMFSQKKKCLLFYY